MSLRTMSCVIALAALSSAAHAGPVTVIPEGSFISPMQEDFNSFGSETVLTPDHAIFQDIGFASVTPSGMAPSFTDQYSFSGTGGALYALDNASFPPVVALLGNATLSEVVPSTWTFILDNGTATQFGLSFVDADDTDWQLDFFNDGAPVGATAFTHDSTDFIGFENTDPFDQLVLTMTGGGDLGAGLDDLTLGNFVVNPPAPQIVPEPSTFVLGASILVLALGFGWLRRRRFA